MIQPVFTYPETFRERKSKETKLLTKREKRHAHDGKK
jgi:hypothetical protein